MSIASIRHNSSSSGSIPSAEQLSSEIKTQLPSFDNVVEAAGAGAGGINDQIAAQIGEASSHYGYLESIGLAQSWWWPPGLIQHVLEIVHVTTGLPWWATIALTTVAVRAALFPLFIKSSDTMAKNSKIKPQLDELQAELHSSVDTAQTQEIMTRRSRLLKEHGIKTRYLFVPMIQLPLALGFFAGIRAMTAHPVDGFVNQGFLWFQDLSATDPYLGLQCLSAAVIIGFMRLGGETGAQNFSPQMLKVFTILPIVSIPLTAGLSSGVVLYFFVNGLCSVIQSAILKNKSFRKRFNIAEVVPPPKPDPNAPQLSMIESFKKTLKTASENAEKRAIANAEKKQQLERLKNRKSKSRVTIIDTSKAKK